MRSEPSRADRELIQTLAADGVRVSQYQLERWRNRGLLPRPFVERARFGGSAVPEHPPDVLEAARILGQLSTRGRPWQLVAAQLFEAGLPISTTAMRGSAMYLWRHSQALAQRRWFEARAAVPEQHEDEFDLADVAFTAAELADKYRSTRGFRSGVERILRIQDPGLHGDELREAVERALLWRVADLTEPGSLDSAQRQLARFGTEAAHTPDSRVLPLPSDVFVCTETMLRSEAYTMRIYSSALIEYCGYVPAERLLVEALWDVAYYRLNHGARDISVPMTQVHLEHVYQRAMALAEDVGLGMDMHQMELWVPDPDAAAP